MLKPYLWFLAAILVLATLAGCGSQDPTADVQSTSQAPSASGNALESPIPTPALESDQVQTLRMALLPVLDVLPLHVAQENGYFEQAGVKVEAVPVKSPQERDTLMQTRQVDGMLTDLISPVLFNQAEAQIMVVRTARKVYPGAPMFRILAAPGSEVQAPADLAGVEIGISQNSVIEYLTDRMLENAGLTPDQIAGQEVSAIPVRFELLVNGEILAACLPDPLASAAIAAGAVLVVDDTSVPELSQSILTFSTGALESKPEAVRRFLQAWDMAVQELNANPEDYQSLLIEAGRVPESVQGTYQMPPFPEASVPTPEQLADVVSWMLEKGLVQNDVPYERMVDASYLP